MKKQSCLLVFLGLIINLSVIAGCGNFSSLDTTILGGMEYFPHAQGNTWNYKNTIVETTASSESFKTPKYLSVYFSGTKFLGTYETQILNFFGRADFNEVATFWPICFPSVITSSSLEVYYFFSDSEILQIKSTPTREIFGIVYALPKFPIVKGKWEPYGWLPENPFDSLGTAEVLGKETVTVEAGVFYNCIKISYADEFHVWLAPDVGLVKTTFTISAEADRDYNTISTTELVSKSF